MSFRPVRDPITGRIDMVPDIRSEWGEYGRSESARNAIGKDRYDSLYPDDFLGNISSVEDMHDATIVEIVSLLAPHTDDEDLGKVTRKWVDAARLVRDGTLRMATIAMSAHVGDDGLTNITINITNHETVVVMFCSCGDPLYEPIVYWNDNGAFAMGPVDNEAIDDAMINPEIQKRRWETTELAIIAARKQAEQPAGVVDMASFRTLRAVRG